MSYSKAPTDRLEAHTAERKARRERITAKRYEPADGQKIASDLLGLITEHADSSAKWQMFSEIVTRCAFDVVGNAYGVNEHGAKYNGFDNIFKELKTQPEGGESLYRKVLNHIPLYQKGIVQTPHPTEVLDSKAIRAEIKLHHAIEELCTKTEGLKVLNQAQKGELKDHLQELFGAIKPVEKGMEIKHEINRSIEFSELAFNAVPQMMHAIVDPAIRHGLRNTQPLTFDELRHFGRMIEPCTWSPGDRDSKPDMTTEMLQYGIEQNRTIMALQYAVKIEEILKGMGEVTDSATEAQKTAHRQLKNILHKILKGIPQKFLPRYPLSKDTPEDGKTSGDKFLDHYWEQSNGNGNGTNRALRQSVAASIRRAAADGQSEQAFASPREMIEAVESIRQIKGAQLTHVTTPEERNVITPLDTLVAQMHCFGNYALRAQIRENAEMHEKVMNEVAHIIPSLGEDRKQRAEKLLDILCNPERAGEADTVRQAVQKKLGASKPIDKKRGDDFYETLSGMKLATTNPDAIPHYLIAECRDSTDILEAFALLKLMEPKEAQKHVEIVPLVEYRHPMENIADMMKEAYANQHFREHHAAISKGTPALKLEKQSKLTKEEKKLAVQEKKTDIPWTPEFDDLTVAEIKKAYDIALKDGDETKKIHHTKMVMFAGSDIMKSAGVAGAALTQHAIEDLRAEMLNLEDPVLLIDYTGLGGGIHRSQPAATSFETTQGRSMRQTAGSIAQKAVLTMARFIRRILDLGDDNLPSDKIKRNNLAQLNLGNIAGFPVQPEWWEEGTKERCESCMDRYKKLYDSPEFACMLAFSADKFAKLTSYAARPAGRIGSSKDTADYPPVVDVNGLRAIGYGTALNVSGSCASLFYGMSDFLHADKILTNQESIDALVDLYQRDPKVQDVINRATFGVTMADLDAAWKYLGVERAQAREVIKANEETAISLLRKFDEAIKNGEAKMEWLGKLSFDSKRALAIHALAGVDKEYQKVSQVLLQLHSRMAGKHAPEPDQARIHDQIIEKLPQALQSQIRASRENIKPVRDVLAEEFHQSCLDKDALLRNGVSELRNNHEVYDPIYYRMGVLQECFENVPRALTRPYWALATEPQHSLAP